MNLGGLDSLTEQLIAGNGGKIAGQMELLVEIGIGAGALGKSKNIYFCLFY